MWFQNPIFICHSVTSNNLIRPIYEFHGNLCNRKIFLSSEVLQNFNKDYIRNLAVPKYFNFAAKPNKISYKKKFSYGLLVEIDIDDIQVSRTL